MVCGVVVFGEWCFGLWCVGLCGEGRGDVDAEGLERMDVQLFGQITKNSVAPQCACIFQPKSAVLVSEEPPPRVAICFCENHDSYRYSESREAIPADDDQSNTKVKPNSHSQVKKLVEAVGPADVFVRSTVRRMQTEQEFLLSPAGLAVRLIMEGRHVETRRRSGHPYLAGLLSVATWR